MKYRVKLPDGSVNEFDREEDAINFAKSNSVRMHKVISIDYFDGTQWRVLGIAYPSGTVQIGTRGFGMFKR